MTARPLTADTFDPATLTGRDKELWRTLTSADTWNTAGLGLTDDEGVRDTLDAFTSYNPADAEKVAQLLIGSYYQPTRDDIQEPDVAWESTGDDPIRLYGMRLNCQVGATPVTITRFVDPDDMTTFVPPRSENPITRAADLWRRWGGVAALGYAQALDMHLRGFMADAERVADALAAHNG